jgi:transcriptional regulator with XRE-family HTH domain
MIGQRIKERRKELHITQMQIRESVGISTGNLSEIENGHILPSSTALINLSQILKCSVDYILFGESSKINNHEFSDMRNSIEEDLLRYFRGISDEDQEELLLMAQLKYNRTQKARKRTSELSLPNSSEIA